ncbi:MAG: protein-L-isoaspartate O-methyltransferase [Thermoplasmata archaeon]|nr:protein-L-isoaspartate O-methyltransferase [Thermoplasmata archaeon]
MSYEEERERMVQKLIRAAHIHSPRVVEAMRKIPRHYFVDIGKMAYVDSPMSIGDGQTISAPHMVGIMLEALDLRDGQKVLEVGGGSGYHAALVGEIIGRKGTVYSVERIEGLALKARSALERVGLSERVSIIVADGSLGLPEHAPYERVFVTCAAPAIPEPLVDQLEEGGKLLIPVGGTYLQDLVLGTKKRGRIKKKSHGGCVFVPLVGRHGF